MFKIEFYVEDKFLARVLHILPGFALDLKTTPVSNAEPAGNGKVKAITNGQLTGLWHKWCRKRKITGPVSTDHLRKFCREHGYSENSYGHVLSNLREHGVLTRQAGTSQKFSKYDITPEGLEPHAKAHDIKAKKKEKASK